MTHQEAHHELVHNVLSLKGTAMQIEEALTNDRLRVLKVS